MRRTVQSSLHFARSPSTRQSTSHYSTVSPVRLPQPHFRTLQRTSPKVSALLKALSRCRFASTRSPEAANSSPSPSTTSAPSAAQPLRWDTFFALRRRRRLLNTTSSTVTGVSTFVLGTAVLSGQNPEMFAFGGVDPIFVMAAASLGAFFGGWLVGPVLGGLVWRMSSARGVLGEYQIVSDALCTLLRRLVLDGGILLTEWHSQKERDFFDRIKRFRVDPTSSSVQNPVPDYYGERIKDVKGYRAWLKDQRAFNRKRRAFV